MKPEVDLEALLDGVWQRRRAELLDRAAVLCDALALAGGGDQAAWAIAAAEAHRLAGALGTLGFHDLGAKARTLELALPAGTPDDAAAQAALPAAEQLLAGITSADRRPASG